MLDYEKIPARIYEQSFATIESEAVLGGFNAIEREIVIRMIHACGMVDLAGDVAISKSAIEAGRKALSSGKPIVCDVEMVRRGIITRLLPRNNETMCNIGSAEAKAWSEKLGTTRSAGAIESMRDQLTGAIIVIGNAPTALFHLLEMIGAGAANPALIIGCPVGFVGACESKQALIDCASEVPFITVTGRRGGSAIAAAALNGLAGGLRA